jgi:lactoylglutathione lyase
MAGFGDFRPWNQNDKTKPRADLGVVRQDSEDDRNRVGVWRVDRFSWRLDAGRVSNTAVARLNLVVLRVADIDRSAAFYALLGLQFTKHAHGAGPQHYACESNGVVFELYPNPPGETAPALARIGFEVPDVDELVERISTFAGAKVIAAARDSEWGRRAVIADPDGHHVELLCASKA